MDGKRAPRQAAPLTSTRSADVSATTATKRKRKSGKRATPPKKKNRFSCTLSTQMDGDARNVKLLVAGCEPGKTSFAGRTMAATVSRWRRPRPRCRCRRNHCRHRQRNQLQCINVCGAATTLRPTARCSGTCEPRARGCCLNATPVATRTQQSLR